MIQRIQTLFLLAAAVFMGLMLFLPLAEILTDQGENYTALSSGLTGRDGEIVFPTWPVLILVLVISVLLILTVFLYRNRRLQIRICIYSIILSFGLIGLMYYYWFIILRDVDVNSYLLKSTLVFPVVAIIFIYLAFRGIRRDEALVRSLDKIR